MSNRRHFLKNASLLTLGAVLPFESVFAADKLTAGVIYVGARSDYGYNQAQAVAANVIKKLP
jgi:basic membrane protein A